MLEECVDECAEKILWRPFEGRYSDLCLGLHFPLRCVGKTREQGISDGNKEPTDGEGTFLKPEYSPFASAKICFSCTTVSFSSIAA